MVDPVGIDDKGALPGDTLYSDRILISRSNKVHRVDIRNVPQRMTARAALTAPALSDFPTWVNQSTAQLAQLDDGIRIYSDTTAPTGANIMCRVRAIPTGAWDVRLASVRGFTFKNFQNGGLVLYESATQKAQTFGFGVPNSDGIHLQKYNTPTSFNAGIETAPERNMHFQFFRALQNGSNMEFYHAVDGKCWTLHHVMTLTSHFTTAPDQWGFYIENNNSNAPVLDQVMDILHWSE